MQLVRGAVGAANGRIALVLPGGVESPLSAPLVDHSMAFWQPRSVLQLLLLGFFAALAPLSLAILFTVQTLGELAEYDRNVTREVVNITRLGEEVQDGVLELERRARQYFALGDDDLGDLYARERSVLLGKLNRLRALMLNDSPDLDELQQSLQRLSLAELTPIDQEQSPADADQSAQRLEQTFSVVTVHREAVEKWLSSSVDQLLEKNAANGKAVIDALVLQVSSLALATLALLLFFAYWVNKPVKDLAQEIDQLGSAGLSHTIEISGPQEVQMLGSKLEWLRSRLHDADQQKQQFLRHISHELKTPLASLREGADLLAERVTGGLTTQQEEIVEIVRRNGIELQRLIENLLDYNQVPNLQLRMEEIRIEPLVRALLSRYRISVENKGLSVDMRGSVDSWTADLAKISTTLDNLLSNAVVYSAEGGIIDIAWRVEDASLVIDVANSGEPIPAGEAERLFEPFFQGAARRSGPIKGSGIGLSVARECIEVQGGSLELATHERLPICFRLICPAQQA